MNNDGEGPVYNVSLPPNSFQDTGFVTHCFGNGDSITTKVIPSDDECGFAIAVSIKYDENEIAFTMDRFAGLCMVEAITRTLLNQEELIYLKEEKEKQ